MVALQSNHRRGFQDRCGQAETASGFEERVTVEWCDARVRQQFRWIRL